MSNLTPKQHAWNAFKIQNRKNLRSLNTLRYFFVPRRLRTRVVRVRLANWWIPGAPQPIVRVLRGRPSNPTVLR